MAPIIDVIRHAEATHNVTGGSVWERDPELTTDGEAQAGQLGRSYPYTSLIYHVVCSPMRRAVKTALIAFEDHVSGTPAILLPELQETGVHPSDHGQSRQALLKLFRPQVDVNELDDKWNYKGQGSKYEPDVPLVEARAREARVFLRRLARKAPDDAHIVVVSHGGFLHFLTNDFAGLSEEYFTSYRNTGMRSFEFADLHGDDVEAKLVETRESCLKSGLGFYALLSEEEKAELKSYAVRRVLAQKGEFDRMTAPDRPPMCVCVDKMVLKRNMYNR
ncbi:histidine phosphatase superfamily [Xylariaceae sp. FL1019]|nr:histidine phosphatase superfamily [Xylariaceae sp. FL1019]